MKKVALILVVVIMASCGSDNPEAIRKQIVQYEDEVNSLNEKIMELEQQLDTDTVPQEDGFKTLVRVQELAYQPFNHYINVNSMIKAENEAYISPEMSGQISSVHVKEGQRVSGGQLMISLKTDVTEKTIQEVKTNLDLATKMFEKQKDLWEQNIGSEVEYLRAKTNKESLEARLETLQEQLQMAKITAPYSGIVESIMVKKGEMAMPGVQLIHLVNLKNLMIEANVSEKYMNSVREGEEVDISFPAFEQLSMNLPVSRVGSIIDKETRTFALEIEVDNPDEKIKPNQIAILRINDFHADSAFVIPSIVIKQDISGYYVYHATLNNDGKLEATKVYVEPGRSYQDMTMINEGLKKEMRVIVEGYNMVKDGTEIKIKED